MGAIYNQYKSRGLEVLMAAVNQYPNVPEFIQRYNVPFRIGTADPDKARVFFEFTMTSPTYVPWLVFIDRKGVIREQCIGNHPIFNQGTQGVARVIEPLLAEKAAPAAATK